ncbi:MAG: VOC family protein [Acidimicrobiales bacterium]|jgi:catechol 2,3-dioxygenase-like lactoylglutathione lyase family enzyme
MILAAHTIIFADDAEKARAFFRDVLELPYVDAHNGWLIFKLPPSELGIHPTDETNASGRHRLYLMCDDVEATVAHLASRGVEFTSGVEDQGFGLITTLEVPGAGEISLYQPKHATAYDVEGGPWISGG